MLLRQFVYVLCVRKTICVCVRVCVCVCVYLLKIKKLETMCLKKKNQPKKIMHETMTFSSTN